MLNSNNATPPKKPLILLVDDKPDSLEVLAYAVENAGYSVQMTTSATAAIGIIEEQAHQLVAIISDFEMPEMSGSRLREATLEKSSDIPFIICSGFISRDDALSAVNLKIAAFLQKPFTREDVRSTLVKETARRQATLQEEEELLAAFMADSDILLEEMEGHLLSFESQPNDIETVNRVFAIAHTIKGTSGFFKPDTLHKFTHTYEDYLSPFKTKQIPISPEALTVLLKGFDLIKDLMAHMKASTIRSVRLQDYLDQFSALQKSQAPQESESGNKATASSDAAKTFEPKRQEDIKVPLTLLDEFMELSGEMTVIRNMLDKVVKAIDKELPENANATNLLELVSEMHKINSKIQYKISDIRKVPLKTVFRPLPRILRDLVVSLKKDIQFTVQGDDLRVDSALAEVLTNSLVHMLRNSADHGIENAETRSSLGKNPQGKISIKAVERKDEIVVSLSDDGKGLDTVALRKKIVDKGMYTGEAAQALSEDQIRAVIFESGFSTATHVTDISGRGVGMDMVKKSVQKIGGRIDIHSEVGQGTQFDLVLPIPKSVLILQSLLVRAGEDLFFLPQDQVSRLLILDPEKCSAMVSSFQNSDILQLDGQMHCLINLRQFLLSPQAEASYKINPEASLKDSHIVVVECERGRYGIVVDEILEIEDAVVKKFDPLFRHPSLYLGATFKSDSTIGLIIDIENLANQAKLDFKPRLNKAIPAESEAAVKKEESEDVLLLGMGNACLFGIQAKNIHRIEEIDGTQLEWTGHQPILAYRDTAMPIYIGAQLLNEQTGKASWRTGEKRPLLVLASGKEGKEHFIGIAVDQIHDLVRTELEIDGGIADRQGVLGTTIINDHIVTMLDLEYFKIQRKAG